MKVPSIDVLEYSVLPHSREAIDEWANALQQRFPDALIAIRIESRKATRKDS